jgi:HCOMODA/2-hydroxy-3-carboxy-muconic semialdehyde decarboxylase
VSTDHVKSEQVKPESTNCEHSVQEETLSSVIQDRGPPSPPAPREILNDLVAANHIAFRYGVVDAFGHVSVRHHNNSERFLLARNMAPGLVTTNDIVEFHLDGSPVNSGGRSVYLERFLHGEIYRTRRDVTAVIHSHAPQLIPFGVSPSSRLQALWHMSAFLGSRVPVFEIRKCAGDDSDLLIRSGELGAALADDMGSADVILMRGHGATVVGGSLKEAVFRAVYTQLNADIQLKAMQLGDVVFLSEGEAKTATLSVGSQVDRAWNLWKNEVQQSSAHPASGEEKTIA